MSDSPLGRREKERRIEEEIMDEGRERPRAKVVREKDFRGSPEQVKSRTC